MAMQPCEVCGNEYDKTMKIHYSGEDHFFDCFECAISALAPVCQHCHCRIIGHGSETEGRYFCCAHCARAEGKVQLRDRAN